ncbi:MAG: chaperone NapD [Comamonadaceae bacterium]|nr:chaperone NapD [Comamonadaceae bacterium]
MTDELHIASLVVHVLPNALSEIEQALTTFEELQVHGTHPDGKLVVSLEGPSANFIMDQISEIRLIHGVLNVSLVYQHTEPRQLLNEGVTHD